MRVFFQGQIDLFRRVMRGTACLGMLALLTACPGKDNAGSADASQVVAQVNDSEISVHQVQALMQMQPGLTSQLGDAAAGRVLDNLIEQELAAQAARKAGLDSAPRVLQAMELAKREVLARAYQDQLADKATLPDTAAIDRYYDEHPELFAQRRQYTLQEMQIKASPEQAKALQAKAEGVASPEAINVLVTETGLPHFTRNTMQWAENIPSEILPKLAFLRAGQSIGLITPDGLVILTVLHTDDAPVTRGVAQKTIQTVLIASKRKQLVKDGMDALKRNAKIERKGAFASGAASASKAAKPAP
jgi:EpsD family peptidyl-prolyl cis-trans isomerase